MHDPSPKAGKLKATPLLKFFKAALRTQYDLLCNTYTYYGCRDMDGAFHAMDFSEYVEFAKSAGFRWGSAGCIKLTHIPYPITFQTLKL
jgi:hypothetical protein